MKYIPLKFKFSSIFIFHEDYFVQHHHLSERVTHPFLGEFLFPHLNNRFHTFTTI